MIDSAFVLETLWGAETRGNTPKSQFLSIIDVSCMLLFSDVLCETTSNCG